MDEIRETPDQTFLFSARISSSFSTVLGATSSAGADIVADEEVKEAAASDLSLSCVCQKKVRTQSIHSSTLFKIPDKNQSDLPTEKDPVDIVDKP